MTKRMAEEAREAVDVVVTMDYETFDTDDFLLRSDLRIDWRRDLLDSTERLAAFLEGRGAVLTVLWDTVEYFWLLENGERETARRIEEQLRGLVRRGHDVQLHLHPAWQTVERRDGRYVWTDLNRRIPTMPSADFGTLVERSVRTMRELFLPIRPGYRTLGFRGRSYDIEPFRVVCDTLVEHGIVADSSKHGEAPLAVQLPHLDRSAPEGAADFLEYPIYRVDGRRWDFSGARRNVTTPLHTLDPGGTCPPVLVMTGHCKQEIHYDLFEECLAGLRGLLGDRLRYRRWQDVIERDHAEHCPDGRLKGRYGKRYFDSKWRGDEDPFHSMALEDPYYRTLLDMIPEGRGGSLLDLGCAEGGLSAAMADRIGADRAVGVDIAPTVVARAAAAHPGCRFEEGSALSWNGGERFSAVVSSQSLYYFSVMERRRYLENVESLLEPGGLFLAAWWTETEYGNDEREIEAECAGHFRIVEARTHDGGWTEHAVRGVHRLLLCERRLDLDEEDALRRIYWEDKRVLCIAARGADLKARFGGRARAWADAPEAAADGCDVLICDGGAGVPLELLRVGGSVVCYGDPGIPGLYPVSRHGRITLSAKLP